MTTYVENEICEDHKTPKTQQTTTNTNMSEKATRLDRRILDEFEFSLRDDVIQNLLDFVECPLLKNFSKDMVIFNQQCYDFERFDKWLVIQQENNDLRGKSGYGATLCDKLIDPMSGEDVGYAYSMKSCYFSQYIPRERLADVILKRLPMLYME